MGRDWHRECVVGRPQGWRRRHPATAMQTVISHEINTDRNLATLTIKGSPSFAEWRSAVSELLDDPDFRPGMAILSDRREIQEAPDRSFIERMVDFLEQNAPRLEGSSWALVAASPADFGMLRMLSIIAERTRVPVRAFRDYEAALAWLEAQQKEQTAKRRAL